MRKYEIDKDLREALVQMDSKLNMIEVKGDSVHNLFATRLILKDIFDNIKEIVEEKQKEE